MKYFLNITYHSLKNHGPKMLLTGIFKYSQEDDSNHFGTGISVRKKYHYRPMHEMVLKLKMANGF
jgi:hypothetical protein